MFKLFYFKQFNLTLVFCLQTVYMSNSSTEFKEKTLSGPTTPSQSRHGNDGNEGLLRIPPNSSIIETYPSDCLVLYPGHSLRGSFHIGKSSEWHSEIIRRARNLTVQ